MKSATDVVATDLDLLSHQLEAEFERLSGRSVLIAGGAGFLGYCILSKAHSIGIVPMVLNRPSWSPSSTTSFAVCPVG